MYKLYFILSLLLFFCGQQHSKGINNDTVFFPFSIDHRSAGADAIDISFLLEKPAGKTGFIQSRDGILVRPDGTQIKLWGVNITDWTRGSVQIPEMEDAAFYAKTLSRFGINCVRLTFLDFFLPVG